MPNFSDELKKEKPEIEGYREKIEEVPSLRRGEEERGIAERKEVRKEKREEEKAVLKRKIEEAKLPKEAEFNALKEADKIREMEFQGQVNRLLDLAKTEGLAFAQKTAENIDKAGLLDLFHDRLIETGIYKDLE